MFKHWEYPSIIEDFDRFRRTRRVLADSKAIDVRFHRVAELMNKDDHRRLASLHRNNTELAASTRACTLALMRVWRMLAIAVFVGVLQIWAYANLIPNSLLLTSGILWVTFPLYLPFLLEARGRAGTAFRSSRRLGFFSRNPATALVGAMGLFDSIEAFLPHDYVREEFGDGLEFMSRIAREKKPAWKIRVKAVSTIAVVFWNVVRGSIPGLRAALEFLEAAARFFKGGP